MIFGCLHPNVNEIYDDTNLKMFSTCSTDLVDTDRTARGLRRAPPMTRRVDTSLNAAIRHEKL
jgi:hypothetical protein